MQLTRQRLKSMELRDIECHCRVACRFFLGSTSDLLAFRRDLACVCCSCEEPLRPCCVHWTLHRTHIFLSLVSLRRVLHLLVSCDHFFTCTYVRVAQANTGWTCETNHLRAFSKSISSTHHVSPGCSKFFFLLFDTSTDVDTFASDADWNQTKPMRDSALGWTVWPSGRPHSTHRLWAQLLHRRQQWAHADPFPVQEKQLQPHLESFLGMSWSREEFGKEILEDLEELEASEIYPRRINAKELLIRQKDDEFIFPVADGTAKLSGRDYDFREPTLRREQTVRSQDLSGELQGEPEELQPTESRDDAEARRDFYSVQGDFIYRHHNEPEFSQMCRKKKHSLCHWNTMISSGQLTPIWTSFKKSVLMTTGMSIRREVCQILGRDSRSREILTKAQTTTRPDHVWPEVRTNIGKAAQMREKQEWAKEKRKLDNARRIRGIFFVDPEDEYIKKSWRMRRRLRRAKREQKARPADRKLERGITHPTRFQKRSMPEKWKLMNPQGNEWNHLYLQITKTTSEAKDTTQWTTTIWYTSLFLCLRQWKFRMRRQQWTRPGSWTNSAELETVRFSKSPTTVVGSQRRSANKRRNDSVCQRIGFIRDSGASRWYTGCSVTRNTLRRSRKILRVDEWSETTTNSRWKIKCSTENNVPIVVPGLSTDSPSSAAPSSPTSVPQEAVIPTVHPASTGDVRVRVAQYADTGRMNQQKPKTQTQMETTRPFGETRSVICQNGQKNSQKTLWTKEFQYTRTHPRVLLVNQLQSREEKWYRARTVLNLTSRRTEIVTSAWGQR